ncbi:hypothetical protein ACVWYN_002213 [Pedobacter sp. UYP24]
MEQETKNYYLPPWRSITIGVILMIIGLGITFGGIDLDSSLWENLQRVFISFEGVFEFFTSILFLLFKAGFIAGGYLYLKYADGVERAKLDNEGFYYREIPKGSKYSKVAMDTGPLTFRPYSAIRDITYKKSFWMGGQLFLTLESGIVPLVALGVLNDQEKLEIIDLIKMQIRTNPIKLQP